MSSSSMVVLRRFALPLRRSNLLASRRPCTLSSSIPPPTPPLLFDLRGSTLLRTPSLPGRCFSSSSGREGGQESARAALVEILTRERAEEIESDSSQVPPELADLHAELTERRGWKMVNSGAVTTLSKVVDFTDDNGRDSARKVQVRFHCQDTVESVDEADWYDGEGGGTEIPEGKNEEEVEDEPAGSVRFTVTLSSSKSSNAPPLLIFQCIVDETSQVKIESVAVANTVGAAASSSGAGGAGAMISDVDPDEYQGPVFGELAEDLQDAFHQFLQADLGVDEDVAAFVSMQSDHREQVQYVSFLETCREAVSL